MAEEHQEPSKAILTLLQQHASSSAQKEELEYVAELVLDAAAENQDAELLALRAILEETLDDTACLQTKTLETLLDQLVAELWPAETSKEDERAKRREEHIAKLRQQFAVGKACLVVLEEDDEWHPATIAAHVECESPVTKQKKKKHAEPFHIEIEFIEFGKKQVVRMSDIVLDEDRADKDDEDAASARLCEMCERPMNLTAHHLIPRVTHPTYLKKGYTKEFLSTCIMICRACHSKIHSTESERTLAHEYNTLDKIMAHPEILRWVQYARKQKARIKPVKKSKWPVGK
uniref:Tudor domain-containing protein n=1 Tax=Globisporangium ultimum (strain ATCC 200006 / CBS 805.95 / DAOM BR144) TaxID=431595 RepID=K3WIG1_GLOUD